MEGAQESGRFFEKKLRKKLLLWAAGRFQHRGLRTEVFCGARAAMTERSEV